MYFVVFLPIPAFLPPLVLIFLVLPFFRHPTFLDGLVLALAVPLPRHVHERPVYDASAIGNYFLSFQLPGKPVISYLLLSPVPNVPDIPISFSRPASYHIRPVPENAWNWAGLLFDIPLGRRWVLYNRCRMSILNIIR
jgi:hypothetical protein